MEGKKFTIEEEEQLIDFVRENECLYNVKLKEYKDAQLKKRKWEVLANELKKTGKIICIYNIYLFI